MAAKNSFLKVQVTIMQQIHTFYRLSVSELAEISSDSGATANQDNDPCKTRKIVTFFPLGTEEIAELVSESELKSFRNLKQISSGISTRAITKDEFIEKLKKCFEPLFFDRYLATNAAFADDSKLKKGWLESAVSEAKKYYASALDDSEHIFLIKSPKAKIYRDLITKNFADDLSGGFILTDKYMYIDENIYKKPIEISNIIKFVTRFLPMQNEYLISMLYYDDGTEKERYLLQLDSRAHVLCEHMNGFIYKYRKYIDNISD